MKNLNPYNQDTYQKTFKTTDTYLALANKYDVVSFDKFVESFFANLNYTPRYKSSLGRVSAVPWYYLNYLDTSGEVVDLGCGDNFFKPYFSNLTGIGAETDPAVFFGDVHGIVDEQFFKTHVNAYHSVFSINALHFTPLENLREVCINFANMIKPGGRGFLALNAQRMIERCTGPTRRFQKLDLWIRRQFDDFPVDIKVLDIDLSVKNAWMDGNIRIVFSK